MMKKRLLSLLLFIPILVEAQLNTTTLGEFRSSIYELPRPSGVADDYLVLQDNINIAIKNGYKEIHLPGYGYHCSKTLIITNLSGKYVEGVHLYGDGGSYGPPTITVTNPLAAGIDIIGGKGIRIENIIIFGQNTGLLNYTVNQVCSSDTLSFLTNGVSADVLAPHAGFVVDGMIYNREGSNIISYPAGSTDIQFINCRAQYFTVGYCLQPGGLVQNGEIIKIENCWGDYCRSAISTGQSQQRTVLVNNFHCWGWTKTVFDCVNFSNGTACPPIVTGLNLAGCVRYLTELGSWFSEGLVLENSHIESLWSLGGSINHNWNSLIINNSWIQFQGSAGGAEIPKLIYEGAELKINNSYLSHYGSGGGALGINVYFADFNGVSFDEQVNIYHRSCSPTYTNCRIGGYRFGDNLVVSKGAWVAELSRQIFYWYGHMSCEYAFAGGETRWSGARNRVGGIYNHEWFIPQLILGDITKGNDTVKNVVVEGGYGFENPPFFCLPEFPAGVYIISKTDTTIIFSAPALVNETNAAIISGNWHGEYVGILPDSNNPYRYGWKIGDRIMNNRFDLYPKVISWKCIKSGTTGTSRLPKFLPE